MTTAPKRTATLLAAALTAVSTATCTVGPDYKRPPVGVPKTFRSQITPAEAQSIADLPWWAVFDDPALQGLIGEALANNYDLQTAVARIEEARALVAVARSEGKPQLDYQLTAGRQKSFIPLPGSVGTATFTLLGGLLNAAWEADVWGRIRRSTEAARANLYQQEAIRRGVMLTLVTDVAAGYFRLLELDRELAIAEDSARAFGKTLDLFTLRYQAGKDSVLPSDRSRANFEASNARVADLKRQIAQQENALSILCGGYPRAIPRGRPLEEQVTPATPLGVTTDVLQRRPDILAAEQAMVRANAQVGVAVADYFPRVGLSALVGGVGVNRDGGFEGFNTWNVALSATGPIFTGGRLRGVYEARRAFWDQTVAQYKQTVLVAFRETSDALAAQQTLVGRRAALENQVRSLQRSVSTSLTRYDAGRASYFEILEAQQQLYPAEAELAQTRRDQLLAVVNLYKALGGGWNLEPAGWSHPQQTVPNPEVPAKP
jgi:multidrug efflux system outer membrane protein